MLEPRASLQNGVSLPAPAIPEGPQHVSGLPRKVRTRDGHTVDISRPIWSVPANREGLGKVRIRAIRLWRRRERPRSESWRITVYDNVVRRAMTLYLATTLRSLAPRTVEGILDAFLSFEAFVWRTYATGGGRVVDPEHLTVEMFERWAAHLGSHSASRGNLPAAFRRWYKWVVTRLRAPGFTSEVLEAMCDVVLEPSLIGHIARMRHPRLGAFSAEERMSIYDATYRPTEYPQALLLILFFLELGVRPESVSTLCRRHFNPKPLPTGEFLLALPRVKRRRAVDKSDVVMLPPISPRLGLMLLAAWESNAGASEDAPLLPWLSEARSGDGEPPRHRIARLLKVWADEMDLVTGRVAFDEDGTRLLVRPYNALPTAPRLHVTAQRFRRTMATMMVNAGASMEEVAAKLGDRTLAMAAVYAENSPEVVDVLRSTLERHPDWIRAIRIFRGMIAEEADQGFPEILGGVPYLADYEEFFDIGVVGHCRKEGDCNLEPPLSCYTCEFFRVARERHRHERQLQQIVRDADRGIGSESARMATVLQRTAAAIAQAIAALLQKDRKGGPLGRVLSKIANHGTGTKLIRPSGAQKRGPR